MRKREIKEIWKEEERFENGLRTLYSIKGTAFGNRVFDIFLLIHITHTPDCTVEKIIEWKARRGTQDFFVEKWIYEKNGGEWHSERVGYFSLYNFTKKWFESLPSLLKSIEKRGVKETLLKIIDNIGEQAYTSFFEKKA